MGGREDIWYASNIEIVDYMEATGRLQFGAGGDMVYNPSAASLWIEVDLSLIHIYIGWSQPGRKKIQ